MMYQYKSNREEKIFQQKQNLKTRNKAHFMLLHVCERYSLSLYANEK